MFEVKCIPAFAFRSPYIVVSMESDGTLKFYGTYPNAELANEIALQINGVALKNPYYKKA